MPVKRKPQIYAWSFSRRNDYKRCPLLARLKYIDKIREPPNDAMARGSEIHTDAEKYATKQIARRPKSLELFAEEFKALRRIAKHLEIELELAVTKQWKPCEWFARDAWMRAKVDCGYPDVWSDPRNPGLYHAIDFKTGKIRGEHVDQLSLYALAIMIHKPSIAVVDTALWYLDQGEVVQRRYSRDQMKDLQKYWTADIRAMMADRTFKATPGNACRWCWYGQSGKKKGGPGQCRF